MGTTLYDVHHDGLSTFQSIQAQALADYLGQADQTAPSAAPPAPAPSQDPAALAPVAPAAAPLAPAALGPGGVPRGRGFMGMSTRTLLLVGLAAGAGYALWSRYAK